MTVYTTVPLDDSNLDVTVTENADLVSIDINPASFTGSGGGGGGAVDSVNAKIGIVVLDTDDIGEGVNKYYTDAKVQTVIDTNTAGYASTTYVDTEDATTLSTANTYTDTSIAAIPAVDLSSYETIVNSNAGDATTLSSANTYTDTSIAAIPATDLSAYSTTVQVEALPVSTFTNDSGYSTTTYVDTNDATTLASANSYTDSRVLTDRGTGVTSTYVATVVVGGTTFNMPAVTGEIKSDQGYFELSYAGATGITVATLTAASTYVYLDNAGALQQQVTIPTRQDWSRKIFVMRIAVDLSNNTIIGFEYLNNPLGHYANSIRDVYEYLLAQGIPFKKDQLITGRAADLGFDVSAGTLLEFGGTGDINNANILDFTAVSNAGFFLTTRTAFDAGGNTDLPKFWDNGGTLTALGSTTVVGHRIYRFSNGNLCLQYGQGNYANINLAEAGVLLEDYVLNPILKNATFFGWWLLQETATNTGGTTLTKFVDYTIGVSGGSSSGLSGALLKGNNLSDLIDAATARTNLGIDLANLPVHVVSDTTTGTYAPPKMLNRSGDSAAFDFVTDDQTYAGAYSARLGLVSWANLASNNVAVASFKSTNDNQLFNLTATGSADDGSHDMDFKLRGATGYLSTRDNSSPGGALTDMTIEGTNLKLKSPIINFNDNFTFPNADGTVDQVMSTDGAGNLSWVTASGGGGLTEPQIETLFGNLPFDIIPSLTDGFEQSLGTYQSPFFNIHTDYVTTNNIKVKTTGAQTTEYILPTVGGTVGQVLTAQGVGNAATWATGGSGGATALSDLTDVALLNLQDGDLLRYNGTGAEWQNTNLGISIAPTVTLSSPQYSGTSATATITNYSSYDSANIWAQVVDSNDVVLKTYADMTLDEVNGTVTFVNDSAPGTGYKLQTRIQDFGDLASEITESVYDQEDIVINATFRHFKIGLFTGQSDSANRVMLGNFALYGGQAGAGTKYPTNMTTDTTPSPFVADASKIFAASYAPWKAFDGSINSTFWWNLGTTAALTDSVTIDLGSSTQIQSFRIAGGQFTYRFTGCTIWGSDTGVFGGEETLIINTDGLILYPDNNLIG